MPNQSTTPTTYNELDRLIRRILPAATIEEHRNGELVIYTGLTITFPGDGDSLRTMTVDEL